MIKVFLFSIACIGCIHSGGYPDKATVKRCTPILQEIIDIQDERSRRTDEFSLKIESFNNGEVSRGEFVEARSRWMTKETSLRESVTELYTIAYSTDCI